MTAAFEARYRAAADPWETLSSPYELAKAERTLAACGPGPFGRACELGAGIGALTAGLAPRCGELTALDASPTAVAAAGERLAPFPQARAVEGTIPQDLPDGPFDLVVASEVLYYLTPNALTATAAWLADVLAAGGRAVAVGWTGRAQDMPTDAAAVARALARTGLAAVASTTGDGYRIDVLERAA